MDATTLLAAWVAAASAVALALTVLDKARARHRGTRVPERVLLGWGLAGGTPGLALGMLLARHKTRKASFLARLAGVLVLQAAVIVLAFRIG